MIDDWLLEGGVMYIQRSMLDLFMMDETLDLPF